MTYEKARKIIETAIAEVEWNYPLDYDVAFEKAIEAIDKQIPQKAVNIIINQLGIKIGICPRCNDSFKVENVSYCSNCGQALDWSETR